MSEWQPMNTAPKNGTLVRLRRLDPVPLEVVGRYLDAGAWGAVPR